MKTLPEMKTKTIHAIDQAFTGTAKCGVKTKSIITRIEQPTEAMKKLGLGPTRHGYYNGYPPASWSKVTCKNCQLLIKETP